MDPVSSRRSVLVASAKLLAGTSLAVAAGPATVPTTMPATGPATRPDRKPGTRKDIPPQLSFIANDRVRLGIDLALGGAITHLSPANDPAKNIVNSWDLGRQIQMSYYAGPVPFTVPGHAGPPPNWHGLGWNPIQVGDDYGNPSRVVEHRNDGRSLYVRCVPMQWPLDDVPGECTFESRATLDGSAVRVRNRLTMTRQDNTQWPARNQELPAIYTNGRWCRLFTYTGDEPFTGGPLTEINHPFSATSPWTGWQATERWAAQVDRDDWGLGVWSPETTRIDGGFAGKKGAGGPKDSPTGYLSPNRPEILDHNTVHEYRYALCLGTLREIREWVYAQPDRPTPPRWSFESGRRGWYYVGASDGGWPIDGGLRLQIGTSDPQLIGPPTSWFAKDASAVEIDASFEGNDGELEVFWKRSTDAGFGVERRRTAAIVGDGVRRTLRIDLSNNESYSGLVTQLRVDPNGPKRGTVYAISMVR